MVLPFIFLINNTTAKMDTQETNQVQEQSKSFDEKVRQLTPKADMGDRQAIRELAWAYWEELPARGEDKEFGNRCYNYVRQAIDMGDTNFYVELAALCGEGIGVRKEPADAVHYLRLFIDEYETTASISERATARYILGCYSAEGEGTQRDVPYGYSLIKESAAMQETEEATSAIQELEERYPFDDDGEIDLGVHGRSKWLSFFIILGILGSIWGLAFPHIEKEAGAIFGVPFHIGMIANLAIYLGLFFWQKWSGWAILAQWPIAVFGGFAALYASATGDDMTEMSPLVQLGVSQLANPMISTFILVLLQRRKPGYALPWCSVTGMRDDGRNLFARLKDMVMKYGEGDAYRADSDESKSFSIFCYVATSLIIALGLYVGYLYITSDKSWGMDIEWKCWKSPGLWGFLSFIGFFLQFFDWQHFSYKTITIYKDENDKVVKRERNRDVLTEVEGSFLYPLLMHLLVIPAVYGAILYYVIMGAIALLGALIPYAVAVLAVGLAWPFYKTTQHFFARRWRVLLLALWTAFVALFLLALGSGAKNSFSSHSGQDSGLVESVESVLGEDTDEGTNEDMEDGLQDEEGAANDSIAVVDETEDNEIPETTESIEDENEAATVEPDNGPVNEPVEDKVYDVVEVMPSFPGGDNALMQYLSNSIKYPVLAEENGVQGRVICTFVVERDGSLTDVKVMRSVDPSLDKEAVRVIKSMPHWNPGRQGGMAVRVKYTIPVIFRLG